MKLSGWVCLAAVGGAMAAGAAAQGRGAGPDPKLVESRNATEKELESLAIVDRKVMVPMRDGKRMATDVYRPKDTSKKYPIIFVRTPYNFNFWDVRNGVAARHDRGTGGREARVRLRGDERARPLLLRRRVRHSGRAADPTAWTR